MEQEKYDDIIYTVNLFQKISLELKNEAIKIQYMCENFQRNLDFFMADLLDVSIDDETEEKCFLYYILNAEKEFVKIGISNCPQRRVSEMQTSTGYYLELLHTIEFPSRKEAMDAESFLHRWYSEYRRKPFKVNKTSEWFDAKIVDLGLLTVFDTREKILKVQEMHSNNVRNALDNAFQKLGI